MARLYVRSDLDPSDREAHVAVLVVDPDGTPGERALDRLGAYCYEGDGAFFLLPTDGWAERTLDGDRLTVTIAVYPYALEQVRVDPADFPLRSALDPDAAVVLSAEVDLPAEVAARSARSARSARLSEATAVFTGAAGVPLEALLASGEDWPMVLADGPAEEEREAEREKAEQAGVVEAVN
ncbi:hypothetical protein AB0F71_37580 [Kitasatospora sp. NPDC028055]|uniref:hypothetical protein n=1 Tax=Kitasatospora sp. NPDC028055 TaxID=3155653 RepID=UPI003405F2DD